LAASHNEIIEKIVRAAHGNSGTNGKMCDIVKTKDTAYCGEKTSLGSGVRGGIHKQKVLKGV